MEDLKKLADVLTEKRWSHQDLMDVAGTLENELFSKSVNHCCAHYRNINKFREESSVLSGECEELEEHISNLMVGEETPEAEEDAVLSAEEPVVMDTVVESA